MVNEVEQLEGENKDVVQALRNQTYALNEHAIVSISDTDGKITYANDRFCNISGYSRGELVGNYHNVVNSGEHNDLFWENLWGTITSGKVWQGQIHNRAKDGSLYWVDSTIVPMKDCEGNITEYMGVRREITKMKQLESSLFDANEVARKAGKTKDLFLANMSHEMRTPLNSIIGFSEILMTEDVSDEDKLQMAQIINKSGNSMLSIVNDILDFSKLQQIRIHIEDVEFNLKNLLNEIYVVMKCPAEEKNIALKVAFDSDLPEIVIGDPGRLRQVLLNLLSNAIKFTNEGNILFTVKIIQLHANQVAVNFSVKDSGVGISEDKLDIIFEQFEQADVSVTREFGGIGLGLSISKSIVTLMGSRLHVASLFGKGSDFSFTLVLPISNNKPQESSGLIPNLIFDTDITPIRILICEDNIVNQNLLKRLCTKMKLTVDVAENGAIGVNKVQENQYALVLMDMQMPVLDGLAATRKIRDLGYANLPILALTANAFESDRRKCFDAGMNDFLPKPVKNAELFRLIERWLLVTNKV